MWRTAAGLRDVLDVLSFLLLLLFLHLLFLCRSSEWSLRAIKKKKRDEAGENARISVCTYIRSSYLRVGRLGSRLAQKSLSSDDGLVLKMADVSCAGRPSS